MEVTREEELQIRGKAQPLLACYVNRLRVDGPYGPVSIGIDDEIF